MGAAIFTLPAGIATFANSPMGVIPAVGLLAFVGLLSGYCFSLIGRVCSYTGATSYKDAWAKSVGEKSSWIPNLASLFTTMQALIAYSIVLSTTIPQLLATAGVTVTRTQSLFSVTTLVLLPLCLMRTLSALAPFSLVGLGGLLYTATAMVVRFCDGSYAPGGIFFEQIEVLNRPHFGSSVNILSPAVFLLASRISNAFMAHYQAPKLLRELRRPTIPRFQRMVGTSYGIVFIAYAIISSIGFLTFGQGSSSFILNNYSTNDALIQGSRFAIFLSLLFSYPLTFVGLRDNMMDFIWPKRKADNKSVNVCTLALLAFISLVAYFVSDIGTLLSLGGATWANWLTFLFPTVMFLNCAKRVPALKKERPAVIFTMIVGLVMSAIGTKQFIVNQLL
jgi:amino acid permease